MAVEMNTEIPSPREPLINASNLINPSWYRYLVGRKAITDSIVTTGYAVAGPVGDSGLTMTSARLLGRTTASAGAVEQITIGAGLSLSAGALVNSLPMTYPGAGIAVSTGTGWSLSKAAPSGTIVGHSDTQTLTNKTIDAASNTLTGVVTLTGSQTLTNKILTAPVLNGATDALGAIRAVPRTGSAKTGPYALATGDVGSFVEVGSGGSVTIPDATFATGDAVTIFNNTSGNITITCSITTAYIAGTNTDVASVTLATRGLATILFISGTVCAISGNVS